MTAHSPIDPAAPQPSPTPPSPKIDFEPARLRPRYDGWTAEKQVHFIEALVATKCVDEACRRVGMSDTSAYELRDRPCGASFRKAWELALELRLDRLEDCMLDRAINGTVRPIFHKGEKVGEYRHFDERLAMFLLRARRPQRYGRWIDTVPPPEPVPDEDRQFLFVDALIDVALNAPPRDGNPLEDWSPDDDEEEEGGGGAGE